MFIKPDESDYLLRLLKGTDRGSILQPASHYATPAIFV
jgi:hypothetical protein